MNLRRLALNIFLSLNSLLSWCFDLLFHCFSSDWYQNERLLPAQSSHLSFLKRFVHCFLLFYWERETKKFIVGPENSLPPIFKAIGCKPARLAGYKTPVFNIWCLISFCIIASMENISSYPIYTLWLDYKFNLNALQNTFTALLAFQFCNGAKEATRTHMQGYMHPLPHPL